MIEIKICGVHNVTLLSDLLDRNVNYIGMIFAESKRRISTASLKECANLVRNNPLTSKNVKFAAVFLNQPIEEVELAMKLFPFDFLQLHGDETIGYCKKIKKLFPNVNIIKTLSVPISIIDEDLLMQDLQRKISYYRQVTEGFLLDAKMGEKTGGTGTSFPWDSVKHVVDNPFRTYKVGIAGGLSVHNVEALLRKMSPDFIDVNSGVEIDGIKNINEIDRLLQQMEAIQMDPVNQSHKNNMHSRFGEFGGQFVPETLMYAVKELESEYAKYKDDPDFINEYNALLKDYAGRETPLFFAQRLTEKLGGAKIYLKREDLTHTGAHKINNTIGQAILAKRMGKKKIVAETGAGQHGVATATVCALLGLECTVFMGEEDVRRQQLNVFRMELLGAKVESVTSGTKTLKDATNEALRYWVSHVEDTFYIIGSVVGPHPYPTIVRDFQRVIGDEAREQMLTNFGVLPNCVIACVGGGSNAIGMFTAFLEDEQVRLIGVEAAGEGIDTDRHAATMTKGTIGILHGMKTYLLQNEFGQIVPVHSISAGLDYPGIGPQHAFLKDTGRVTYNSITDEEAMEAFMMLSKLEGIIPALESSHAVAEAMKIAPTMSNQESLVICLSGRGDKDVNTVLKYLGGSKHE